MGVPLSRLGIVIVSHDHQASLKACLDSLEISAKAADARIVVRDCGSRDGSSAVAAEHPLAPDVIEGPNVGFGAACNDAVASLGDEVDLILFLNPDTTVEFPLHELLDYTDQLGPFGCVGIKQLSFDGALVWSWDRFPSPRLEWAKARQRPLVQRSDAGYHKDQVVDWVMGSFLLIPRAAFHAVGGFDESFFLFNEEVDLCHRLHDAGYQVFYIDAFSYYHQRDHKDTLWREVLRLNARRRYDRKWLPRRDALACRLAQTYRWLSHLRHPEKPTDRRLVLPRLLATWNLLQAQLPAAATGSRPLGGLLRVDQAGHLRISARRPTRRPTGGPAQ